MAITIMFNDANYAIEWSTTALDLLEKPEVPAVAWPCNETGGSCIPWPLTTLFARNGGELELIRMVGEDETRRTD